MSTPRDRWATGAFHLLWAGQTVNGVGSMVSTVAIPLVALNSLHASAFQVGLLAAVEWVPALLFGLLAGVWVDRHRRRPVMMGANLGQAAAVGLIPACAWLGLLSMPVLLGAAALSGLFGVYFRTAYSPYLRTLVPPDQLAAANGKLRSSRSAATISGPAAGGVLVQLVGAAATVIVDAASFLISFACLWRVGPGEPPVTRTAGDTSIRSAVAEGFRCLARAPLLRDVTLTLAAVNFLLTAAGALDIVFLTRDVHTRSATIGLLLATGSIGGLAGALVSGRLTQRLGMTSTAQWTLCCTAPAGLLIPLTQPGIALSLFAIGMFALTFGIAIASVAFATLRQLASPPQVLGRVSATSDLLMSAALPAGALTGGALGDWIGPRIALLTILIAINALATTLALNGNSRPRTPDNQECSTSLR